MFNNILKSLKVLIFANVIVALAVHFVFADNVSFDASVNTAKISLGSAIQLTLTINNAKSSQPIELPKVDGFESRYLGPSTRVSIVNGQYSSSIAYVYTLFPLKTGKFQIPAITTEIEGKTYTSKPIDVEVADTAAAATAPQEEQEYRQPAGLENKIFLTLEVSKTEAYDGEKIPVTIKLFVNGLSARDIQLPEFEHAGFSADEFSKPKQYQQVVGGVMYEVVEFNTNIYPARTGELTLGPANLALNLLYKSSSRSRPSPFGDFGSFFDDDFFNSFFDNYQKHPLVLKSAGLDVRVNPLPAEGKPQDFSGAVGQFDFKTQAGPSSLKVGDPVTLRMTVSGNGDLKNIKMPTLENIEGFKLYDPQIKEENGSKILEQVLIPANEQVKEIPEISFSYFDPEQKKYQTIKQGPFVLKVAGANKEEGLKVVVPAKEKNAPVVSEERPQEQIGRDIIFIKEEAGEFGRVGYALYRNSVFLAVVIFTFFILSGFSVFYNRTQKLKTDTAYARRFFAPKKAKKGLDEARRLKDQNKQKEFYDVLFKTLQEYFSDKFHLPAGNITAGVIEGALRPKEINGELLRKVKEVFDACDMVRYASSQLQPEKMKENFTKTQEIIDFLERHWK